MNDYKDKLHDLFYHIVMTNLKDVSVVGEPVLLDDYETYTATSMPKGEMRYHYERDLYRAKRQSIIMMKERQMSTFSVVISFNPADEGVTIWKNGLDKVFKERSQDAFDELKQLLDKFYDKVTVEQNRYPSEVNIDNSGRVNGYRPA